MTRAARPVSLASVLLLLAAAASGVAAASAKRPNSSPAVGTITNVLHSKVYVNGRYVAVTPLDVFAGDFVRTDAAGQATFDLSRSRRGVVCAALEGTTVQVTPPTGASANVVHGSVWCSLQPSGGTLSAAIGGLRLRASEPALVGITVGNAAVLKLVQGRVFLTTSSRRVLLLTHAQQLFVGTGTIVPHSLTLTSAEQVAIARVRLAQPSG